MTDFRALCAKVLAYNEGRDNYNFSHLKDYDRDNAAFDAWQEIKAELKSALAQPEPEGPTLDDIWELCEEHEFVLGIDGVSEEESANGLWAIARAVLARWGRPTPQPIPVSERLPGPGDCDAEGLCWWWRTDDSDEWWELLCITDAREYNARCGSARYTHWLPAHALPVPSDD